MQPLSVHQINHSTSSLSMHFELYNDILDYYSTWNGNHERRRPLFVERPVVIGLWVRKIHVLINRGKILQLRSPTFQIDSKSPSQRWNPYLITNNIYPRWPGKSQLDVTVPVWVGQTSARGTDEFIHLNRMANVCCFLPPFRWINCNFTNVWRAVPNSWYTAHIEEWGSVILVLSWRANRELFILQLQNILNNFHLKILRFIHKSVCIPLVKYK